MLLPDLSLGASLSFFDSLCPPGTIEPPSPPPPPLVVRNDAYQPSLSILPSQPQQDTSWAALITWPVLFLKVPQNSFFGLPTLSVLFYLTPPRPPGEGEGRGAHFDDEGGENWKERGVYGRTPSIDQQLYVCPVRD